MQNTTITVLNSSERTSTAKMLARNAKAAAPKARAVLKGLAEGLTVNPVRARGAAASRKEGQMAHKKRKKATAKRRAAKTNPTGYKAKRHRRRVRSNPSGFGAAVSKFNLTGLVVEGAAIVAGELGQSLVQKQVQRMFPSLPAWGASAIGGGVVAGLGIYLSKGKQGAIRSAAIGAIAGTVRGLAKGAAPGLFAGLGDAETDASQGYYDPALGRFVRWSEVDAAAAAMQGLPFADSADQIGDQFAA